LQAAFNKYGEGAFTFLVLEDVENASRLIVREQCYLDTLNPEYNICPTAGSSLGCSRSPEACRKNSEAHKGKHHGEETKRKIGMASRGRRHSEETKRKIAELRKGVGNGNYGKHHSAEWRQKISEAWTPERRQEHGDRLKGKSLSNEHRNKISAALMGHSLSEETKRKIGKANGDPSTETRRRISESLKAYWREKETMA